MSKVYAPGELTVSDLNPRPTVSGLSGNVWMTRWSGLPAASREAHRNVPAEPGWYWARPSVTDAAYTVLVEVVGKAPWLKQGRILAEAGDSEWAGGGDLFFGPKIEIPEPSFVVLR